MMQSRQLFKVLGPLQSRQLHRHSTTRLLLQTHKCTDAIDWNTTARYGPQVARCFSVASHGASVKEGNSGTTAGSGAELPKENSKIECNEAEGGAKSNHDSGEHVKPDVGGETDLQALLKEKEALLKEKDRMVAQAKQQVLTCLAEVENVRGRTRRDAEGIKKHAVESFATDLLDMADNLGRAAATVPENVRNETLANDSSSNAKLLKSLIEGVDMTEKQFMKIFNKFGVQKFDPVGQRFDSNQHLAIVEVEDSSKEPQTIVNVVKSGYFFHDKIIRPAEVGVVKKKAE